MFLHCQRCDLSAFMKILKHLRNDWFRYGFETIAVVVGILIAFALDNWSGQRKLEEQGNSYRNLLEVNLVQDSLMISQKLTLMI